MTDHEGRRWGHKQSGRHCGEREPEAIHHGHKNPNDKCTSGRRHPDPPANRNGEESRDSCDRGSHHDHDLSVAHNKLRWISDERRERPALQPSMSFKTAAMCLPRSAPPPP